MPTNKDVLYPPKCSNKDFTVIRYIGIALNLESVLINWTDDSTLQIVNSPAGSTSTNGEAIIYEPPDSGKSDLIRYTATNDAGTSSICICNITIIPPIPICSDLNLTVKQNTKNNSIDLTQNIQYWTNQSYVSVSSAPALGRATVNGEGLLYTTFYNYTGTDSLQYVVTNETGISSPCNCGITILPAPSCTQLSVTLRANTLTNVIDLSNNINNWDSEASITIIQKPLNGSANVKSETLIYTPSLTFYGTDSIKYIVTNDGGTSSICECDITVLPDIPECSDMYVTINEGTTNYIALKNVINWIKGSSTVFIPSYPVHGTLSSTFIEEVLSYETSNYYGSDVFQFQISNPGGISSACNCFISIIPTRPKCTTFSVNINEGTANNTIDISPYVYNWTPSSSSEIVVKPRFGTAILKNERLYYTPAKNFYGDDSVQYTATNLGGTSSRCLCNIHVVQYPPICYDLSIAIKFNSSNNVINLASHIKNWSDNNGSLTVLTQPANGIMNSRLETLIYTPTEGYTGSDTIQYIVNNEGGSSSICNCNILVVSIPTCVDVNTTMMENATNAISLTQYITGWSHGAYVKVYSSPSSGTVSVGNESLIYTPNTNFFGNDTLQYTVSNISGTSTPCNCNIQVNPLPPICKNFTVTASEGSSLTIDFSKFITNWIDSSSSIIIKAQPLNGTATPNDESVVYDPNRNFYGNDGFMYMVSTSAGNSLVCACNIVVFLSKPACSDFSLILRESSFNNVIDLSSYITGFVNGFPVNIVQTPSSGTVVIFDHSEKAVYTPIPNYLGNDSFQYNVINPKGYSSSCSCKISIIPRLPICSDVTFTVKENSTSNTYSLVNAIMNWLSAGSIAITKPSNGTASISVETVTYTPTTSYYGSDLFQYTVTTAGGSSNACNCNIVVSPFVPVCTNVNVSFLEDTTNNIIDLTKHITQWTRSSSIQITKNSTNGTATINNESISYTPNTDYTGNDSMQYTATNETGVSNVATISITIIPLPPVCNDFSININDNENGTETAINLRKYISGIWTEVQMITAPTQGSIYNNNNIETEPTPYNIILSPTFGYIPPDTYVGTDSFQFNARNSGGVSNTATATINLLWGLPICQSPQTFNVTVGTPFTYDVLHGIGSYVYPGGPLAGGSQYQNGYYWDYESSIAISTQPVNGTATLSGSYGSIVTYTASTTGSDSLVYVYTNSQGSCSCKISFNITS